ncbi:MAG: hypothetical protein GC149_01940 [Gammaproteobacteria bacterium]|nr:hypothetical protein [Gammaproteobacteria bacterium]
MLTIRKLRTGSAFFLSAIVLAACGGGSGDPAPTKNFTSTDISVLTSKPEIGYPLDVSVDFNSNESADNVSVSLYAVEKDPAPGTTAKQYPLGSQTLAHVTAGTNTLQMKVNIPSNVDLPGQYYLTAMIDPAGVFRETDKDDNTASTEITIAPSTGPNIKLVKLELDRSAMLVNTDSYTQQVDGTAGNVYNSDAGGTITVAADGLDPNQTLAIDSFAKLRIHRTDTNTTYDLPLYLWNTALDRYINAYGVDPSGSTTTNVEWLPLGTFNPQLAGTDLNNASVDDTDRDSAHIEFYLPGKLGQILETAARHYPTVLSPGPTVPPPDLTATVISQLTSFLSGLPYGATAYDESAAMAVLDFSICVDIRPSDSAIVDQDPSDNESCAPIAVSLPPLPTGTSNALPPSLPPVFTPALGSTAHRVTPVPNSHGNPTKGGNSMFGFALDFGSTVTADNHGYVEEEHGYIPVTILGIKVDFLKIDVRAQLIPNDFVGKPAGENSDFTIQVRHVGQLLASVAKVPSNVQVSIDVASISKEYPKPPKEAIFMVGPIPLSLGASVSGNFGLDYQPLVFTSDDVDGYALGLSGGPYANLEARAYAAIGSDVGGFAAGVEGILSLLDERIEFFNGVDITLISKSSPAEFIIRQGPKITNIFTGPQGFINLYAKYTVPTIKQCKVGVFKIPCPGFKTIKATKNLLKSKALFKKSDVLYENNSLNLDVVIPTNDDPIYYSN